MDELITSIQKRCEETKEISLKAVRDWQNSHQKYKKFLDTKQIARAKQEYKRTCMLKRVSDYWCARFKEDRDWLTRYTSGELDSSDILMDPFYFHDSNSTQIRISDLEDKKFWWSIGANNMAE